MDPLRLNLPAIQSSLRAVQTDFDRINRTLTTPRDAMTDGVLSNMMAGYRLVDDALASGLNPFEMGHSRWLLELNALVLCGTDACRRAEFAAHIASTERHFYENEGGGIGALMDWLQRHQDEKVWYRAAGAYIHILSQPQLYIEGNHRTGALVMSYILAREGQPPFVLSVENAKAYFDPSSLAKDTRRHGLSMLIGLPKLKKRFAKLLRENGARRYLTRAA
ncbi:MAG: hypothetical protein LJE61_08160 [Thiocapsa sp.]|jgi:hypothetical protein|nr:hypothetical protein [Thiocapsa sp.]MCG6897752.1 hypothetical protein [Thiocapsa sp.]MCG6985155.1 hypothetical protein [Thiocapsa sp.]